ncbi:MAG: BolA family transcriptional regulator [Gammaproteobacteria bacterium]|nr:MAG: BolA family transcriptional regulator [Gammaproteobacteria bacterium]
MTECLKKALSPISLSITDDSHLHAGHAGAQSGMGHFSLDIVSESFEGLTAIKKHQLVYQALAEMMKTDIHALSIKARPPA